MSARILVVDDEVQIRDIIRKYAVFSGYTADEAQNGMEAVEKCRREKYDVVIMDPPRAGASLDFLKCLVVLSPKKVVYISCNPETQARDLTFLTKNGYRVKKIQPVDMFPHTEHVECVVCLSRK